jgi:hypothetical protein
VWLRKIIYLNYIRSNTDRAPRSDRRVALRQARIRQRLGFRRQGAAPLDPHAVPQLPQGRVVDLALHLHPVGAAVAPARIGEPLLEPAFGGEQQQPFAVGIEAAGGIDARMLDPVGQAAPAAARLGTELAQDPIGFMEEQGVQGRRGAGLTLRCGPARGSPPRSRPAAGRGPSTGAGTPWRRRHVGPTLGPSGRLPLPGRATGEDGVVGYWAPPGVAVGLPPSAARASERCGLS